MKKYRTISDRGDVRIGVDGLTVNIPNGYGDGTVDVFVFEKSEQVPKEASFICSVSGDKINIYYNDCDGEDVIETLSGCFGCYCCPQNHNGAVILQKW